MSSDATNAPSTTFVALIIPVYRGWAHVSELLAGLEPVPHWLTVHVVDDASGDQGAAELVGKYPFIQLVTRERNGGFAAAVNSGVQSSSADVLVVVNSDLRITADTIQRLARVAAGGELIVGVGTARPGGSRITVGHRFPTVRSDAAELFVLTRALRHLRYRHLSRTASEEIEYVDWVVASCLAFSRSLWTRVGPLDESFYMYSEETDWQRRARSLGFCSCWLTDAEVVHDEMHGTATRLASSERTRRFVLIWRSRLRYHRKHGPPISSAALRAAWVLAFAVDAPLLSLLAVLPWRGSERCRADLKRSRILLRGALTGEI
jgi:N-acetylglucosaminyl-diphospho-decaprenol L-rhamnosyltransferase